MTVVNDRTIHLVPGQRVDARRPLGDGFQPARLHARLGHAARDAPLAYATASLDAPMASPWGLQNRVVSSPVHRAVFTAICYFCGTGITPSTPSIVHRFSYDADGGVDAHTAPLSEPLRRCVESRRVGADRVEAGAIESAAGGAVARRPGHDGNDEYVPRAVFLGRHIAATGRREHGLVFINSTQAFSLSSRTLVTAGNYELGGAPVASRDGSRVLFAWNNNNVDQQLRYYDSSAGTIAASPTMGRDNLASLSRHANRAFVHSSPMSPQFFFQLLGPNLAVLGTLPEGSSLAS